jgi:hypothetical protein
MTHRSQNFPAVVAATLAVVSLALAMPASAASRYKIGSSNTVYADPYVSRPKTTPCIVQLFTNVAFENFSPYDFQYTPPANCAAPWQKVVFTADIYVTKGIQYDRTANIWIGPTNIYFGTTSEPSIPTIAATGRSSATSPTTLPSSPFAQEGKPSISATSSTRPTPACSTEPPPSTSIRLTRKQRRPPCRPTKSSAFSGGPTEAP